MCTGHWKGSSPATFSRSTRDTRDKQVAGQSAAWEDARDRMHEVSAISPQKASLLVDECDFLTPPLIATVSFTRGIEASSQNRDVLITALWLRAPASDNFMACAPLSVRLSGCKYLSSAPATSTRQSCPTHFQRSSFCCFAIIATHCALHKPHNRRKAKKTLRTGMGAVFGRSDVEEIQTYFRGKIIWVTGASGGFGEALWCCIVPELAAGGFTHQCQAKRGVAES